MLTVIAYILFLAARLGLCYTTGEPISFELELGTIAGAGTLELTKVEPAITTPLPPELTSGETPVLKSQDTSNDARKASPTSKTADITEDSSTETDASVTVPTTEATKGTEDAVSKNTKITSTNVNTLVETLAPSSAAGDGVDSVCTDTGSPLESSRDASTTSEDETVQSTGTLNIIVTTVTSTKTVTTTSYISSVSGGVASTGHTGASYNPHSYRTPPFPTRTADFALNNASSAVTFHFSPISGLLIVWPLILSLA